VSSARYNSGTNGPGQWGIFKTTLPVLLKEVVLGTLANEAEFIPWFPFPAAL
jgi:hypothetical protein